MYITSAHNHTAAVLKAYKKLTLYITVLYNIQPAAENIAKVIYNAHAPP